GWHLYRADSQGREAGRPAGRSGDKVRAGDQPQDREGAWACNSAGRARYRRRGDRMSTVLLAQADRACHAALSRSIALRVVIISRMTATIMALDFLSVSAMRLWKVLRAGLYRLALRAAM